MSKDKYVNVPRSVRVDEDTIGHLKMMAVREHRSVSNLVSVIIIEAVQKDKEGHGEDI